MVLKKLIFNSFYFGRVCGPERMIFQMVSSLGSCGGLERTDFLSFCLGGCGGP